MKAVVSSLSDVPEALQGEYEERDGRYVLKIEGDLPGFVSARELREAKERLNEFRSKNTTLLKRAAELAGVDEIDDELSPLRQTIGELKKKLDEAAATPGNQELQQQIQAAIKPLKEKLERAESERVAATERANRATLRQGLGSVLSKAGARQSALDFLLDQGERVFQVKDDHVVARDGQINNETGEPVTPKDWAGRMLKEHGYAFESSDGGGAGSGPGSSNSSSPKPGVRVLRNPSPMQLGENMDDIKAGKVQIVND